MEMPNLPDFMNYKNRFSPGGFVEKISRIAKRAGVKLVYAALILYYTLESDQVSLKDIAVLIYVLNRIWGDVSEDVKAKAKAKLATWFDDDEILSADDVFKNNPNETPI